MILFKLTCCRAYTTGYRSAQKSSVQWVSSSIRQRYLHIDDNKSQEIRKHITKLLKYPATLSGENFKDRMNLVVWRLARPICREIYYYIAEIDDGELNEVPGIGKTLHTYKEYYYKFCSAANDLGDKCKKLISTQTKANFQFIHGWSMYFDYFLMRSFGHTVESAQQNVSTNYGITYGECERVFNLLLNAQEMSIEVTRINDQRVEIYNILDRLIGEINKAKMQ